MKWGGPGPLHVLAGSSCEVFGKVELPQSMPDEILMVEACTTNPFPGGVLLQSMVIPSNAVNVNKLTVLIQNESLKDANIPVGTILGCLCTTDVVTTVPEQQPE